LRKLNKISINNLFQRPHHFDGAFLFGRLMLVFRSIFFICLHQFMFIRLIIPRLKWWGMQTNGSGQIKKDAAAPKAAYIVKNNF
jgi:hypothetical protein